MIPEKKIEIVTSMMQRGLNTVQTSSCGRLFDAVASIMGLRHEVNYEGQAAIELEMAAARRNLGELSFRDWGHQPLGNRYAARHRAPRTRNSNESFSWFDGGEVS